MYQLLIILHIVLYYFFTILKKQKLSLPFIILLAYLHDDALISIRHSLFEISLSLLN